MKHRYLVLIMWLAISFATDPSQSGYLPKGTEITELRTANSRHYSNGDGTIRAVIEAQSANISITSDYNGFSELGWSPASGPGDTLRSPDASAKHANHSQHGIALGRYCAELLPGYWINILERGWVEWDISSIPQGATINNVACSSYCFEISGTVTRVQLYHMRLQPRVTDAISLFTDARDGPLYGEYSPPQTYWNLATLNQATRDSLYSIRQRQNWFAIGYIGMGSGDVWEIKFAGPTTSPPYPPRLIVDYSLPRDVGVTKIVRPTGTIDSTQSVVPACSVYNYGSQTVSCSVRMKIGNFYDRKSYVENIAPNTYQHIAFPAHLTWPRGTHPLTCSTELATDMNRANDKRTDLITVRVRDVGVSCILAPTGTVDSGTVITPACTVYNYGTTTESYSVRMKIGSFYNQVASVSAHPPGSAVYLTFSPAWTAQERGNLVVSCSTELSTDMNRQNDKATGQVFVRVRDVGVSEILAPTGTVDSGQGIIPKAKVKNFGNVTESSFDLLFTIDGGYFSMRTIQSLAPMAETIIDFDSWTAQPKGTLATKCTTCLTGDINNENDKKTGQVFVRVKDVGCFQILAPTGTVDSGTVIIPACSVYNYGNQTETYLVRMRIGAEYNQTALVENHLPGTSRHITFPTWVAEPPGTHTVTCSTELTDDINAENDKQTGSVEVRRQEIKDVGVDSIIQPNGVVAPGPIIPRARIRNYGTGGENFIAYFEIYQHAGPLLYRDSQAVYLMAESSAELEFSLWDATGRSGLHTARCSTYLAGDANPVNDKKVENFLVEQSVYDVGVLQIIRPTGTIPPGNIRPLARVYNYGRYPETFLVYFTISTGKQIYRDSTWVTDLYPAEWRDISFEDWNAEVGNYQTKCSTALNTDQNPSNDYRTSYFRVQIPTTGWFKVGDVPPEPDRKRIKSGGGITKCGDKIYILKGNNTRSLYKYTPDGASAVFEDSVPLGSSGKKVKKGGALTSDGVRYLYILKGSNTKEFFRYDTQRETTWKELLPVPDGPQGKRLKGGTGVIYANGNIYLLKGSKTKEFYKYDITNNTWTQLSDAMENSGLGKGYGDGSCLIFDGENIYALRGKYNEFYKYDIASDSWTTCESMPRVHPWWGKKKKVGEGAGVTLLDGNIYAFKGGNTKEFWMYDQGTNTWIGKDTIPKGAERKYVKGGGGLTTFNGAIYALKGNNTTVIYKYLGRDVMTSLIPNTGIQDYVTERRPLNLTIRPNPTKGLTNVYYNLPQDEIATLRIYNILGDIVYSAKTNKGLFTIKRLPPGIYLLHFEVKGYKVENKPWRENRKLIVVK